MLLIKSFSYLYRIWFLAKITSIVTYQFMFTLFLSVINFLFWYSYGNYLLGIVCYKDYSSIQHVFLCNDGSFIFSLLYICEAIMNE